MNVRPHLLLPSAFVTASVLAFTLAGSGRVVGQAPPATLTVLSRDARRAIPITSVDGQEMVAVDDLAATFQVTSREEGGALTVSYKGRTIVLSADQTMVSVAGRVISLAAAPRRMGNRWMVPVDFINRALGGIYDARLDVRLASRLVVVGDLRVPRVSMRAEAVGDAARVTIDIAPRANTAVAQDGSQRLTVRFDADALDVATPSGAVPGAVLGFRGLDATSIAIDLGPRVASFRQATQAVGASSSLVIDLLPPADAPAPPVVTRAEPATPSGPAPPPPPRTQGTGVRTIVIDAGHGGDDAGARGADGTLEKDLTLAVARKLKSTIEARLGLRVVMTRDDDRLLAVSDRTALANNTKADIFISLHASAAFRREVAGAAVFVASFEDGAIDPSVLVPERLPAIGGGFRDIELVPWNLAQIRYKGQSEVFAATVVDLFRGRVPLAATPVGRAPLRVLESANMPAVVVELGYLSNAEQEKLLGDAAFQSSVASAVVDAIARFRDGAGSAEGASR